MSTIFTKIINREIPAAIVYEDDSFIAFLDITQANPGHTLLCTKKEYPNIFELPIDILEKIFVIIAKLAKAINVAFKPAGINILNNNGKAASQSVFHYHIHIIPRYDDDKIKIDWPDHSQTYSKNDLEKRANLIKSALL
ncbi:MAG: HIT family protein [Acholeplasmataceae bacterium]|nr:HIT family protein [Acholeplasmataceae bacterium]